MCEWCENALNIDDYNQHRAVASGDERFVEEERLRHSTVDKDSVLNLKVWETVSGDVLKRTE